LFDCDKVTKLNFVSNVSLERLVWADSMWHNKEWKVLLIMPILVV